VKSYLITDPSLYSHDALTLAERLKSIFQEHTVDYVCYRDKTTSNYPLTAQVIVEIIHKYSNAKILLHGDFQLAAFLHADGVHLTSKQFESIHEAKQRGLYVIISTHTHEEVIKAQSMGADAVTYSPIFHSPNKGNPKGLEDLKQIVDKIRIPIFALGGILSQEQINAVEAAGAYGFASIRYFV
jgi:thiamine-phosphate pyrophosphorylase